MKKVIIIYYSKYGTTQQYAKWLAEKCHCEAISINDIQQVCLDDFDIIVFGSALYAGKMPFKKIETQLKNQQLIVFTVGLANPSETDYSTIIHDNFSEPLLSSIQFFHLRGGIDYSKLKFVDKTMMAMLKKFKLDKLSEKEQTPETKQMLETYGKQVSFVDENSLEPIIKYLEKLQNNG